MKRFVATLLGLLWMIALSAIVICAGVGAAEIADGLDGHDCPPAKQVRA